MTFIDFLIVLATIGLLAAVSVPAFRETRKVRAKCRCITNLAHIRDAKAAAAREKKLKKTQEIDEEAVGKHITGRPPVCPAGGTYDYRPVGVNPVCSIPDHRL
jgi:hypothetical protein